MQEYVFKLLEKDKDALGTVRCMDGLKVAEYDGYIWLRGISISAEIPLQLKQLPVKNTYTVNEYQQIFDIGKLVPIAQLQQLHWQPIASYITVEAPTAALPGVTNERTTIKLVASAEEKDSSALLTTLTIWKQYAETASAIRLAPLQFAVSENDEVLIIGTPLPPLPGKSFWQLGGLYLPDGYVFEFTMAASFINKQLNAKQDAILVFNTDGSYHRIDRSFFIPAKRSAIRLTKANND